MRTVRLIAAAVVSAAFGVSGAAAGDKLIFSGESDYAVGYRHIDAIQEGSGGTMEFSSNSRYSLPFWHSYSLQLDMATEYYTGTNSSAHPKQTTALGAHFSYRVPSQGLIGVFGGYAWSSLKDEKPNYEMALYGVEAQLYRGNWTFYAQAGWGDNTQNDGSQQEGFNKGWFTRGVVRYFISPDTKLEAEISYAEASPYIDGNDDGRFTAWGVSLSHKLFNFRNWPVYGTLAYRGAYYDATTETDTVSEHVFKAGIKVLFGAKDLKQNDRYGATLDMPMLAVRANGFTELID